MAEYTEIHPHADCCRSNGARVDETGNRFTATPDGCKESCDVNAECRYFSHSTEWENCIFCSECDFTYTDNAKYYTSWKKVGAGTVSLMRVSELGYCIFVIL